MFGIGLPEFILILIVGLIVFGPSKLPELGRAVGKGMREFRKASNALQAVETMPKAGEEAASPRETAAREPEVSGLAASGYCPPTQESVRAQLEEQQKL